MPHTDTAHRRRRKEARPQELLDAALALFVQKGFAATRAEEVAALAGVSKGTLYLYYPSKEELLKAVIAHYLSARIAAGAAQAAEHSGTATALLQGILIDWWTQLYDSPASGVFKLVITEVRNFPEIAEFYHREVVERAHDLLGRVVSQGIAQGEFRPVDVDHAVHSLVLPLVMICLHRHSFGACTPADWHLDGRAFIAQHVQLVLAGLCVRPPEPAPAARPTA
ncbi:TetR/AcrR family transcriptional regulator [Pseudaquabacterium pictum]|uniref:TetR family transcriptional regulator n=1 Tax=Pseudaquabacterium pictum TaxID=2315236 RepID=A0A480AIE4_9BURK|nr:TetR/AcrR family transcriptional regulator [Rubrivivax pictus]GCL61414.1 TetR family transcriptional regulator [Rubrivivax pictus]